MSRWVRGQEERVHERDHVHGGELCGREAIRKGNWKADLIPKPKGTERWQLHELSKDAGEIEDLGEKQARKVEELWGHWEKGELPAWKDLEFGFEVDGGRVLKPSGRKSREELMRTQCSKVIRGLKAISNKQ